MMAFQQISLVLNDEPAGSSLTAGSAFVNDHSAASMRLGWLGRNSGFGYFAVIMFGQSPDVIESDIPPEFLQAIFSAGEFGHCSMFARLARSTVAFGWDVGRNCLEDQHVPDEVEYNDAVYVPVLRPAGINGGFCVPVHTVRGERGVIVFLGPRDEFDNDYPGLVLAAQAQFDRLAESHPRFSKPVGRPIGSLETRILSSLRKGQTIDEAAKETKLSPVSVSHILAASITKLGASSVVDAVAIAHTRGLIV